VDFLCYLMLAVFMLTKQLLAVMFAKIFKEIIG